MEENNINNVNDSIEDNAKTDKKKISPAKLIVPIIIVVILAVFAGVVYCDPVGQFCRNLCIHCITVELVIAML